MTEFLKDFIDWIQQPARATDLYGWIFTTLILGTCFWISTRLLALILAFGRARYDSQTRYQDIYGTYYFFNSPAREDAGDAPHVSRLTISRGWLTHAKVRQENFAPKSIMYTCTIELQYTAMFFVMRSSDKSGDKYLITYRPKLINDQKANKLFVGVMTSINFKGEPFSAPVLISRNALPADCVRSALEVIKSHGSIITLATYNKVISIVERSGPLSRDDWYFFPHGHGGRLMDYSL